MMGTTTQEAHIWLRIATVGWTQFYPSRYGVWRSGLLISSNTIELLVGLCPRYHFAIVLGLNLANLIQHLNLSHQTACHSCR